MSAHCHKAHFSILLFTESWIVAPCAREETSSQVIDGLDVFTPQQHHDGERGSECEPRT